MEKLLKFLRQVLDWLKDLYRLLGEFGQLMKEHPLITLTILALVLSYSALYWLAFEYPARTIHAYYKAVDSSKESKENNKDNEAWNLLSGRCRDNWGTPKKLLDGYHTTDRHTNIIIIYRGQSLNPINVVKTLFANDIKYEVYMDVKDKFRRDDLVTQGALTKKEITKEEVLVGNCIIDAQKDNALWLRLKSQYEYDKLIRGKYKGSGGIDKIELNRRYKKVITVCKKKNHFFSWEISSFETPETTLIK